MPQVGVQRRGDFLELRQRILLGVKDNFNTDGRSTDEKVSVAKAGMLKCLLACSNFLFICRKFEQAKCGLTNNLSMTQTESREQGDALK